VREIKFRAWDGKEIHDNVVIVDGVAYKRGYFATIHADGAKAGKPMQYTGLEDKNGKEIFEGDVVEVKHPYKDRYYKGEIIFEYGSFKAKDFYFAHYDNPIDFTEGMEYVEVIGNIYENPELIAK
jgi:uncharacterized phage protein (TIGR01671 family)